MSTFCTKTVIYGSPSLIPQIAEHIQKDFEKDGFEVSKDTLCTGGCDISISKGSLFKAVIGMKTALKVTLLPQGDSISFEAGVGIWGQQAIPTIISMLFFWPVLLTQLWGLVKQSQLDDRALAVANEVGNRYYSETGETTSYSISLPSGIRSELLYALLGLEHLTLNFSHILWTRLD